jgi:putative Holliday junction resolvase
VSGHDAADPTAPGVEGAPELPGPSEPGLSLPLRKAFALGLDVGTKTIGVAGADGLGLMAHPLTTVAREGVRKDVAKLMAVAAERGAGVAVVGLPLELDSTEARSARLARQIGAAVAEAGLSVVYVDERFTSVEAERRLLSAGASRARRKAVIDQVAAAIILQAWLDHGDGVVEDRQAPPEAP